LDKPPPPLLGFNNNVSHRGRVFHIQTEDSGVRHARIVTHLFADGGRILKTTRTDYSDKLGTEDMNSVLRRLMKDQHKAMFSALRAGECDDVIAAAFGEGPPPSSERATVHEDYPPVSLAAPPTAVGAAMIESMRGAGAAKDVPEPASREPSPQVAPQRVAEEPTVEVGAEVRPRRDAPGLSPAVAATAWSPSRDLAPSAALAASPRAPSEASPVAMAPRIVEAAEVHEPALAPQLGAPPQPTMSRRLSNPHLRLGSLRPPADVVSPAEPSVGPPLAAPKVPTMSVAVSQPAPVPREARPAEALEHGAAASGAVRPSQLLPATRPSLSSFSSLQQAAASLTPRPGAVAPSPAPARKPPQAPPRPSGRMALAATPSATSIFGSSDDGRSLDDVILDYIQEDGSVPPPDGEGTQRRR